ncbi:MAG: ABC transporter permease [Bryobacterales bacterium]|nr:ABC transporter permease [Bryobacterales bacterium]
MNIRYAARRLRQSPGFTLAAVLSLAVGIGASVVLFSLVNAAMLRLIPVREPGQLVWFDSGSHGRALSYPFYRQIQHHPGFDGVLCAFPTVVNLSASGVAERAEAELVSANYFEVLGVTPFAGRLLTSSDDRTPAAVVSHAYWRSRLGASPAAVGSTVRVNGEAWTVVGVAPPGFGGLDRAYQRVLFVPMGMKPHITPGWDGLDKPLIAWLAIAGRLRPGVERGALSTELNARFQAFQETFLPHDATLTTAQRQLIRGRRLRLERLSMAVFDSRVASHLSTLGWMVALLLALTCANVAGLLLARGLERHRELATRLAVGASRWLLIRQLLTEALLLALAGGVVALLAASAVAPALASRFPLAGAASQLEVPIDFAVLGFTFALAAVVCVLFGLLPAWQSTGLDLVAALRGQPETRRARWLPNILLAGQVALSVVLLGATGVLASNLRGLLTQDSGFDRQRLLLAEVEPALSGYGAAARLRFYHELQSRLDERAGPATYSAVVMANVAPRSPYHWSSGFEVAGRERVGGPLVRAVAAGPRYLETLRIPLRSGRYLNARDDVGAPRVAVISEPLARREFPDASPLGRRFTADLRNPQATTFEIVGVVGDVNLSDPREAAQRECVFLPYRQWAFPPQAIVLHAKLPATASAASAAGALRAAVKEVDPALALFDIRTMEQATAQLLAGERLAAWLTGFFAAAAALLCALGIYGVVSRALTARHREAAIRLALGASFANVWMQLTQGPRWAVIAGLTGGAILFLSVAPALHPAAAAPGSTLWQVPGALLPVALAALLAMAFPAVRARGLAPSALFRQR